jgi:hypothetical protein
MTWLSARLRAGWLDRQLADGVAPWHSPVHAARALQLTSRRHRRAMARSLERLVEAADQPHLRFLTAAVPPCRAQVHDALPSILDVAGRLRDGEPVDARGIATLRELLSDGLGPCYANTHPGALAVALEAVSQWLDAVD